MIVFDATDLIFYGISAVVLIVMIIAVALFVIVDRMSTASERLQERLYGTDFHSDRQDDR